MKTCRGRLSRPKTVRPIYQHHDEPAEQIIAPRQPAAHFRHEQSPDVMQHLRRAVADNQRTQPQQHPQYRGQPQQPGRKSTFGRMLGHVAGALQKIGRESIPRPSSGPIASSARS